MLPTLPEVPGWTGFLALCPGPAAGTPAGAGHVPALAPVTTRARAHAPPPVRAWCQQHQYSHYRYHLVLSNNDVLGMMMDVVVGVMEKITDR